MTTIYNLTLTRMYLLTFSSRSKSARTVQKTTIIVNSNEEIEGKMKTVLFQSLIVSTYFDYDDYENPVKTYVDSIDLINMLVEYANL